MADRCVAVNMSSATPDPIVEEEDDMVVVHTQEARGDVELASDEETDGGRLCRQPLAAPEASVMNLSSDERRKLLSSLCALREQLETEMLRVV